MYGRWRSSSASAFARSMARSTTSAFEPAQASAPQASQRQNGRGVPQYRSRLTAQSMLFSSQLPKRPCLMCPGYQLMRSFPAVSPSRWRVVRMYQLGFA